MPLWLRRNVAKYNALHPDDQPSNEVINADPPLRKATVKSYNPVTKQAVLAFADSDQAVDVSNFEEYNTCFDDPENVKSSTHVSSTMNNIASVLSHTPDETHSPPKTTFESPQAVAPNDIDDMNDDGNAKLLTECFHCGMADYSANPVGNPFNDVMLSDVDNPLVEF